MSVAVVQKAKLSHLQVLASLKDKITVMDMVQIFPIASEMRARDKVKCGLREEGKKTWVFKFKLIFNEG